MVDQFNINFSRVGFKLNRGGHRANCIDENNSKSSSFFLCIRDFLLQFDEKQKGLTSGLCKEFAIVHLLSQGGLKVIVSCSRCQQPKTNLSEENRTPTRQFFELDDVHHSGESASEGEDTFQWHLFIIKMSLNEVDSSINAIVASWATQSSQWKNSARGVQTAPLRGMRYLNDRDFRVNVPTPVELPWFCFLGGGGENCSD